MNSTSKIQELERLKKLKDDGVLTDEEFAKMKQDILYGIPPPALNESETQQPAPTTITPAPAFEPTPEIEQEDAVFTPEPAINQAVIDPPPLQEKNEPKKAAGKKINSTLAF